MDPMHLMTWTGELWACPTCGRKLRPALTPLFSLVVVEAGDPSATHAGVTRVGDLPGLRVRAAGDDRPDEPAPPPPWLARALARIAAELDKGAS